MGSLSTDVDCQYAIWEFAVFARIDVPATAQVKENMPRISFIASGSLAGG